MAGEKACHVLRADKALRISAALWWFDADTGDWKYLVTSPLYDEKGARAVYMRIGRLLRDAGLDETIPVWRVWATETTEPVVKALRKVFGDAPAHVQIHDLNVAGIYVHGAYLYYLPRAISKGGK